MSLPHLLTLLCFISDQYVLSARVEQKVIALIEWIGCLSKGRRLEVIFLLSISLASWHSLSVRYTFEKPQLFCLVIDRCGSSSACFPLSHSLKSSCQMCEVRASARIESKELHLCTCFCHIPERDWEKIWNSKGKERKVRTYFEDAFRNSVSG